ncbi:MAG: anthranilate phosphoribosyltransferase [Ardenticatenaceae bacterium]|nr:anthranilate phosphoribosyltransferase [Ardenticatenaceae bacterium]
MSEHFQTFIRAVARGEKLKRDLTYDEAADCMRMILDGSAAEAQIGALLMTQRVKGESVAEIKGFTDVIREEFMVQIRPDMPDLLDIACPYNGKTRTAQLAPAVALTLHAAGVPVLLHGAEGIPTKTGITPGAVLRHLGVQVDLWPHEVEAVLNQTGFGFLDAGRFSPAWIALTPLRRQFGLRTVCNTVEKFFNPTDAPYQVSGFFHKNYIDRIRTTQTGTRSSWMIQGEEGSIETAAGRRTHVFANDPADDLILCPAEVGLPERERVEVPVDVAQHAAVNLSVLRGEPGHARDQVTLTAGTILYLLGQVSNLQIGFITAERLLIDGKALAHLERVTA